MSSRRDASPDKLLRVLRGSSTAFYQYASAVAWSPEGEHLAAAFGDRTIRIWNVNSGTKIYVLEGHREEIPTLAWSPDGQRLACGSYDGTVHVWDANGDLLLTLQPERISVLTVAWSPDGHSLASAGRELLGHRFDPREVHPIDLWDAATGARARQIASGTDALQSIAWAPDGQHLAGGGFGRRLYIWDATNGDLVRTLEGRGDPINAVAWSPDGRWLASGSGDTDSNRFDDPVCLWDAATGELLRRLPGHNRVARAVAWSPDGRLLASSGGDLYAGEMDPPSDRSDYPDYAVRVWDADDWHLLAALQGHAHEVWGLSWAPDGRRLASASSDGTVRVWWTG